MAKKNNKRKRREGYFDREIQINGSDFLNRKTPIDIQNNAQRIFRDIARGAFDPYEHYIYFLDKKFNMNLSMYASQQYNYHSISYNALLFQYNYLFKSGMKINDMIVTVMNDHKSKMDAYGLISTILNNIIVTGESYGNLVFLKSELSKYRRLL